MNDGINSSKSIRMNFRIIQLMLWILTYFVVFIYCFYKFDNAGWTLTYSFLVTNIYLITAYGNSHLLIPRFFGKSKLVYTLLSLIFLTLVLFVRMWLEYWIMSAVMGYKWFFNFSNEHYSFSLVTLIFAFLFGALLRIALDHFAMLRQQQEIKSQQIAAELNLLKSQVQPHFLFNALNNIYYLAYAKSDLAPESISRLSDIMRYFVEEAPKEWVPLKAELEFIQDYIEVERIRLPHTLDVKWNVDSAAQEQILIPPILFIPLVENVFKHGVDKTRTINEISLVLEVRNKTLTFTVKNLLHQLPVAKATGTGLANLRKRLSILYKHNFKLDTREQSGYFVAQLTLPLP
jgi:sensor histidine kinase YesM